MAHPRASDTLILCGPGNNGGDGYVAARILADRGCAVRVAAEMPPRGDAAIAAAAQWEGPVEKIDQAHQASLLIDALYGTGLGRPLAPGTASALMRLAEEAALRIAVDLPSGVHCDSGALLNDVPIFDLTIALGARKPAHHLLPSAERCGRIVVTDIGVSPPLEPKLQLVTKPSLRAPGNQDNKYTRGKLVVIGGRMPGAAMLAAMAGQRAGAGYVELVGDATGTPHALVVRPWDASASDDPRIKAVVVGPGLGRDADARERLDAALARRTRLVIDADALTMIGRARHDRLAGHVLTPHAGEFVRLFGEIGSDRIEAVRKAARSSGAIILLKGADSIVAHPDGRAGVTPLASGWLATAGTGDVLAGIVGAMIAQGFEPFDACQAALWLHSETARRAGLGLIADDLITHLPFAVAACL